MTPAQAKRDRARLMKDIAREIRAKNRARLVSLRSEVRAARAARRRSIREAIAACRSRRPPTLATVRAELALARKHAKQACAVDLAKARALKDEVARKREQLAAERAYQREIRRIEADNRRKEAGAARRSSARERRGESDDEVRGNIPPELVELFERVKRQIKGSDRMSRTEAFLHYAEEHPDEQWAALEDRTDQVIRELERRQAMANPRKKKRRAKTMAKAKCKKRCKKKQSEAKRLEGQIARLRGQLRASRAKAKARKNPRRPPRRWFDHCLASIEARRYARDPAAVCGAAWWRMKPSKRASIVRRLEKRGGRHRRAAYAIARAEQRRADRRPPRRKNAPPMSDAAAKREYERTHWGERGHGKVKRARAANPAYGTATKLGRLVSVTYRTRKGGDGGTADYEHEFDETLPTLAYNDGGLLIAGGTYVIEEGGISG